jgi:class 3 adenylate cyclase
VVQTLESGRQAISRRAWKEAWETLAEADRESSLSPQDLELMADAAWWAGHPDDAVDALERAYTGHVEADMVVEAANVAVLLAYFATRRLAYSIGAGWRAKAARLLEGRPESPVHAYIKMLDLAEVLLHRDDIEAALQLADETLAIARRTNNRDAENEALAFKGTALLSAGMWKEGLSLIDEASASALSGNLSLRTASNVYCLTIAACRSLADFGRAGEWTEEADRWMRQHSVGGYPGVCRVHRAELKRLKGAWSEAEEEARGACDELERYRIFDGVGLAHYEVGEIRLLMGDHAGAGDAFAKAYEVGVEPQPGLALLQLARGEVEEAARSLARLLNEGPGNNGPQKDLLNRVRLLPAQVQVALARDDVATARTAAAEIESIAAEFERPAFAAMAATANGEIAVDEGDLAAAVDALDRAWRLWRDLGFPYETARARMLLGQAHLAAGEQGLARIELGAARAVFERLGAGPDLRRVDDILFTLERPVDAKRVTRTFMFTDIVGSTDLIGLIGDDAWQALLAWHDRELRRAFAAHRGTEVSHTGDGFFVSFDVVDDAIEAAVAIQRRLAEHRREHGFATSVRIGLHTAEASLDGADYRGRGVHLAARVAGVAGGEEIVVSESALESAGALRFPVSEGRDVELKGIEGTVRVHSVGWR